MILFKTGFPEWKKGTVYTAFDVSIIFFKSHILVPSKINLMPIETVEWKQ